MLLSLYRYLSGYLDVAITGPRPERLVNLAVAAGMDLWDLRRQADRVTGRLLLADFRAIRPLAREARCRVRIRRRRGLPFLARRLLARRALVAGGLLSAAALLWFTSHIWVVEVRGAELVDARAIRAGAARLGLRPGVLRWEVDPQRVAQRLPQLVPDLGWVAVRTRGTRAVIEVVERHVIQAPPPAGRVDIVAAKNCIIDNVVAFWGLARVKPGEVVEPGQTLIEGVFARHSQPPMRTPWTDMANWPPPPDLIVSEGRARGVAWGRCFYQHYEEVPLYTEERVPTGRKATRIVLRLGEKEILLKGERTPPFPLYDVQRRTARMPGWRNWVPPVEISTETLTEVTLRRAPRAPEAASREALDRFLERIQWHLTPGTDQVTARQVSELVRTPEYLGLHLLVETREEIGRPRPVPHRP